MPFKTYRLDYVFHKLFAFSSEENILKMGHSKHEAKKMGEHLNYIYSYATYHKYADIVSNFIAFCFERNVKRVKHLNTNVIDEYFKSISHMSEKTINQHRSALNKFLRYIDENAGTRFVEHTLSQPYKYQGKASTRAYRLCNPDGFMKKNEEKK